MPFNCEALSTIIVSIIQNKYIIILFHSQKLVHAAHTPNLAPTTTDVLVVLSHDYLLHHLGVIPCVYPAGSLVPKQVLAIKAIACISKLFSLS